jgi:hypothetical protein
MMMDTTNLTLSLLFGMVGMGMIMFGKKAGRLIPIGAGLGLCVLPYFITNTIALLSVCAALSVAPFLVREG